MNILEERLFNKFGHRFKFENIILFYQIQNVSLFNRILKIQNVSLTT